MGGVISLYIISPQMTSVMAVGLPLMIGLGTLMGSGLRSLSRKSQEQVGVVMWMCRWVLLMKDWGCVSMWAVLRTRMVE